VSAGLTESDIETLTIDWSLFRLPPPFAFLPPLISYPPAAPPPRDESARK
jgi:hypothetical protein